MAAEEFDLANNHFGELAPAAFRNLADDELFTDVTLVTGDDQQIKAHKVILGSCSSFFKNILTKNPHPHPLIYLKDITFHDLTRILQFVYLGKCRVRVDDIERFMSVGKDLQVEGLMTQAQESDQGVAEQLVGQNKDSVWEVSQPLIEQEVQDSFQDVFEPLVGNEGGVIDSYEEPRESFIKREDTGESQELAFIQTQYEQEDFLPVDKNADGKYACDQCGYQTSRKFILQTHKESVHYGVKHDCDQCEYKATHKCSLQRHKRLKH